MTKLLVIGPARSGGPNESGVGRLPLKRTNRRSRISRSRVLFSGGGLTWTETVQVRLSCMLWLHSECNSSKCTCFFQCPSPRITRKTFIPPLMHAPPLSRGLAHATLQTDRGQYSVDFVPASSQNRSAWGDRPRGAKNRRDYSQCLHDHWRGNASRSENEVFNFLGKHPY